MANQSIKKQLAEAKKILESVKESFECEFDEHSEKWQEGERGEQCLENIEKLQEAIDAIDEVE